jgi:starch synthase
MSRPLKVLYIAAEVGPFAKVGGLADVAAALPSVLAARGHDVRVVTPRHSSETIGDVAASIPLGAGREAVARSTVSGDKGVPVYLVESEGLFPCSRVYGEANDLERYLAFCRAALDLPKQVGWSPDIFHCNDWHTAPIAFGLRNRAWGDPFYRGAACVLTIHNLRYRGPDDLADFLCQGVYYADAITTVSETYAREILTPEYGEGLHLLLGERRERLFGIINGLDYREHDPSSDPHLAVNFDAATLEQRSGNKVALQRKVGLVENSAVPLVGIVSRLTEQKGMDLTLEAMEALVAEGAVQIVLLGSGDEAYHRAFEDLARRHAGRASVSIAFDHALAQLIYGGCDLFLMPSRFEPCGLGQLIALRYGAIPVVRHTGGLADTVSDYTGPGSDGNGFVFQEYRTDALLDALRRALATYQRRDEWRHLQASGMRLDFSWDRSAERYEDVYRQALAAHGPA